MNDSIWQCDIESRDVPKLDLINRAILTAERRSMVSVPCVRSVCLRSWCTCPDHI